MSPKSVLVLAALRLSPHLLHEHPHNHLISRALIIINTMNRLILLLNRLSRPPHPDFPICLPRALPIPLHRPPPPPPHPNYLLVMLLVPLNLQLSYHT